jgi:hypothetical protein
MNQKTMLKHWYIRLLDILDPGRNERGLIRITHPGRIDIAPCGYRYNDKGDLVKYAQVAKENAALKSHILIVNLDKNQ